MTGLRALQNSFQDYVLRGDQGVVSQVAAEDTADARERLQVYAEAYRLRLLEALGPALRLVNRTAARAEALAAAFGARVEPLAWEARNAALEGCGLLVNTTSLGLQGQAPLEIDLARLPATAVVTDIVYAPLETPLLAAARARGHRVVDGLGMLLHQARPGFEAWFGVRPTVDAELRDFVLQGLSGN